MAEAISGHDVIVFAQGSMEHMSAKVTAATGIPVITAPQLLVEDIKACLEN
jgi:phosphoribosylcarboxyaminoimidazole (NCAIR) mutase